MPNDINALAPKCGEGISGAKETKAARARREADPEYYALWVQEQQAWRTERARNTKRACNSAYRARQSAADGSFKASDVAELWHHQRGKCAHPWCKANLRRAGYHIDHRIPLVLGGSNWPNNLQLLCPLCNLKKNDQHPVDFAQLNGLLV